MATLSKEDGQLYYQLWLPLLDYINKKYKVCKEIKEMAEAERLDLNAVKAVSDKLYEDVSVIDEYLSKHDGIPDDHKEIIEGWKKRITGTFVIERHLKRGSMLISADDGKVYQVVGIISSLEEMFRYAPMPLMIEATLLPFRDVIITDGLIMPYRIRIGSHMARSLKEEYLAAQKSGAIIKSL